MYVYVQTKIWNNERYKVFSKNVILGNYIIWIIQKKIFPKTLSEMKIVNMLSMESANV